MAAGQPSQRKPRSALLRRATCRDAALFGRRLRALSASLSQFVVPYTLQLLRDRVRIVLGNGKYRFTIGTGVVILAFVVGLRHHPPVIPGLIIIWLASLYYAAVVIGFDAFSPWVFALSPSSGWQPASNIWLAALGAKTTSATWRSLIVGFIGAISGRSAHPLIGTIVGYAAGLVLSEYIRQGRVTPGSEVRLGGVWSAGASARSSEFAGGILMILLWWLARLGK